MLSKYIEHSSKLFKNYDGLVVVDSKGIIRHYANRRPEINHLTPELVVNKHVLDVWVDLDKKTSTLLNVLKTGEPIINNFQEYTNSEGIKIKAINTTLPLTNAQGIIIGAVDVSVYVTGKENKISLDIDEMYRPSKLYSIDDIVTNNSHMIALKENIEKIASTDSSVLIYGETGTGKELVAQSIHSASNRKSKPFIVQNCAAIPNTLLESLLFGTVKGSYTGAENRKGLFELANGGTLFLDEINSMDINMQSKILRVLEDKKVKRIGGADEISLNIRVVSAVNVNPTALLTDGILRTDLFYRLSPVQIIIPPLRERKDDIKILAEHYIGYFNRNMHRNIMGISDEALQLLYRYSWPGNVRELRNVLEGCFNLVDDGFITSENIPKYLEPSIKYYRQPQQEYIAASLEERVKAYERELILDALKEYQTLSNTARALKITRQNLRYKLQKHNINITETKTL